MEAKDLRKLLGLTAILAALLCMISTDRIAAASTQGVKPDCRGSLQALIDAASPGSTVHTAGHCIYRQTVVITKPLTLIAGPGAEIRGSDVWRGWRREGRYWIHGGLPHFSSSGECASGTRRCLWPEQVFLDGRPLRQVAENPHPGQFAVKDGSGTRYVVLADDPRGHVVEVSVRRQWVVGAADGVTIKGFTMRDAANERDMGALTNADVNDPNYYHSHWTIEDNKLSDAAAADLVVKGNHNEIIDNNIYRGGQLGIHLGGNYNLVQGNRIHDNNTEHFDPFWEAGGIKAAYQVKGLRFIGNTVYDNKGVGVWCDINCSGAVYKNNRIFDNAGPGILFEISRGALISHNVIWNNGWHYAGRSWSAGIVLSNSSNVTARDNTLAWNASGLSVISMDRGNPTWNKVKNIKIRHNLFFAKNGYSLAWIQQGGWSGGVLYDPSSHNSGQNDRYWYPSPEKSSISDWSTDLRYRWGPIGHGNHGVLLHLAAFNRTPGESDGRYLSNTRERQLTSSLGIPVRPPAH